MRQSQCDQIGRFLKSFWCPFFVQIFGDLSGSPGLVVMAGDSFSEGRGFESQHRKLDGRFHQYFAFKILVFEKTKINEKEAGGGPF